MWYMQHFEALECRGVNNSEARKLQKNCYKCAAAWVLDTSRRFSKDVYPGSLSLAHVCLDIIMVGTWMLCGNGWSSSGRYHGWHMDALWERTGFVWTLSWLAHGCSVGPDGVCLDVIMVGPWMLCVNAGSLSGRYHGWHMDALWERTEFVWTLSWLAHGCSA